MGLNDLLSHCTSSLPFNCHYHYFRNQNNRTFYIFIATRVSRDSCFSDGDFWSWWKWNICQVTVSHSFLGGGSHHTKVQRARWHKQLWWLWGGGNPDLRHRKVCEGIPGVLVGRGFSQGSYVWDFFPLFCTPSKVRVKLWPSCVSTIWHFFIPWGWEGFMSAMFLCVQFALKLYIGTKCSFSFELLHEAPDHTLSLFLFYFRIYHHFQEWCVLPVVIQIFLNIFMKREEASYSYLWWSKCFIFCLWWCTFLKIGAACSCQQHLLSVTC